MKAWGGCRIPCLAAVQTYRPASCALTFSIVSLLLRDTNARPSGSSPFSLDQESWTVGLPSCTAVQSAAADAPAETVRSWGGVVANSGRFTTWGQFNKTILQCVLQVRSAFLDVKTCCCQYAFETLMIVIFWETFVHPFTPKFKKYVLPVRIGRYNHLSSE